MTAPVCDVFIRTYVRDFDWLAYCLSSIAEFCSGFRQTVLVVPASNFALAQRRAFKNVKLLTCHDYPDDYLGHAITKLMADTFTDADFFCHVDADYLFRAPVTPTLLGVTTKPFLLKRPLVYTTGRMKAIQNTTEALLGQTLDGEYMTGPKPFVYPRALYAALRAHVLATVKLDVQTYVVTKVGHLSFSEFNLLGAFAWSFANADFTWLTPQTDTRLTVCQQFSSHSGLQPATLREIAALGVTLHD